MTYLNLRTCQGVETVDELSKKDFKSYREFREEARRLVREYHLAGMAVYLSHRPTKDWTQK